MTPSDASAAAAGQPSQSYRLTDVWRPDTRRTLYHPEGIDVGGDGLLVVAERERSRVGVWTAKGENKLEIGAGVLSAPEDVAVDVDRDRVWVADTGNRLVRAFTRRTGQLMVSWGDVGLPRGIASGPDGRVYVADAEGHVIRVFEAEGTPVAVWGAQLGLRTPLGLAVGADGNLYVADSGNQRVIWLSPSGELAGALNLDNSESPGGVPHDVGIAEDGKLYVAVDRGVLRFNGRSTLVETIPPLRPALPEPEPITDNVEGVRRLAFRDGLGLFFTYAPELRASDRVISHPARWFPEVFPGSDRGGLFDPFRIDAGRSDLIHVLDRSRQLGLLTPDGRPYDSFRAWPAPPGAVDLSGVPDASTSLSGNEVHLTWTTCFANCPEAPPVEVLPENMRRRQDCRGVDFEPDDLWWNRALSSQTARIHAVLDSGRSRVVFREAGFDQPLGALQLPRDSDGGLRPYSDLAHDAFGNLWVLARDGELLSIDRHGRRGDSLVLPGFDGIGADSLAIDAEPAYFVLDAQERIRKFDSQGQLLAAWDVAQLAGAGRYTDIATDAEGRVLVVDGAGDRVLVFERGGEPTTANPDGCAFRPDKTANPSRIQLGETTEVTLELSGSCGPQPPDALDVVVVMEASCDMSGERLRWLRDAFVQLAARRRTDDRLALATFGPEYGPEHGGARLVQPLTGDSAALQAAGSNLTTTCLPLTEAQPVGMAEGLRVGAEALFGPEYREASRKVVILVAAGRDDRATAIWRAQDLWRQGVRVATVAVPQDSFCAGDPPDTGLLAALATHPKDHVEGLDAVTLTGLVSGIADEVAGRSLAEALVIEDWIPDNMTLLPASLDPPADVTGGLITWDIGPVPAGETLRLRYRLRPDAPGVWPTNVRAIATFTDGLGIAGTVSFPVPTVEVIPPPSPTPTTSPTSTTTPTAEPTQTPDPTETPADTATPVRPPTLTATTTPIRPPTLTPVADPAPLFLPIAYVPDRCKPTTRPLDVALVIDVSSSMTGAKLAAAAEAGRAFVELMNLPTDHAAIVTFDAHVTTPQPLTGDAGRLLTALSRLTTGEGTRIDRGLEGGLTQVAGAGSRPGADGVIVILTDGRPAPGTESDAAAMGALARELGVSVFAVGLGPDADREVLETITGATDRVVMAPTESDLRRIYEGLARLIPCR